MDTPVAPTLANLFIGKAERDGEVPHFWHTRHQTILKTHRPPPHISPIFFSSPPLCDTQDDQRDHPCLEVQFFSTDLRLSGPGSRDLVPRPRLQPQTHERCSSHSAILLTIFSLSFEEQKVVRDDHCPLHEKSSFKSLRQSYTKL